MFGGPAKLWTCTDTLAFVVPDFTRTTRAADDFGWTKTKTGVTAPEGNSVFLNAALPPAGCAGRVSTYQRSVSLRLRTVMTKLRSVLESSSFEFAPANATEFSATVAV
jgi:hypothetical protein